MKNFAISAGHVKTAETAFEVLKAGGNAVDAAIAAYFTSWVTEPFMSSAGGGGFANIFTHNKESHLIDFFCQTPQNKRPESELNFYPVSLEFSEMKEVFHIGRGSSAVPGAIAGIFHLHKRFGFIPMKELAVPAIELVKAGVLVNPFEELIFSMTKDIVKESDYGKRVFFKNNGETLKEGDKIRMPELADFLDFIINEGEAGFYKGEIAKKIAEDQKNNGGNLNMSDFERYRVIERDTLKVKYKGKTILTNPLPSLGGVVLTLIMNYLSKETKIHTHLSQKHFEIIVNTFQKIIKIKKTAENLARELWEVYNIKSPEFTGKSVKKGGTTHFNIVDKKGNAVSMSVSNGEGNGYFIPGTGVQMNNMLGEAALLPDGFHSWKKNVRLSSLMTPSIVLDESGELEIVTGTGGAGRIPYAISQVLYNLIDFGLDVRSAVNAPRIHIFNKIKYEKGYDTGDFKHSFPVKEWQKKDLFFGGVHTILNKTGTLSAAGDCRRDGVCFVS